MEFELLDHHDNFFEIVLHGSLEHSLPDLLTYYYYHSLQLLLSYRLCESNPSYVESKIAGMLDAMDRKVASKIAGEAIYNADVIFILDFNASHRSGSLVGPWLEKARATKILIDHHQQPDDFNFVYYLGQIYPLLIKNLLPL